MRTTSLIVSSVLLVIGCSDPGSGASSSGAAGGGGAPGVTSASGTGGSGSGGDLGGSGGSGGGGDPGGSGGSGSGGDPGGSGGSGGGAASLFPCGTPTTWRSSPEAFLDLGHTRMLRRLFVSGDRVLSWDHDRWILWDTATRAAIADGHAPGGFEELPFPLPDGSSPELPGGVELRADLLLVQTDPHHAFELRSAADGSLLAAISAEYGDVGLATDGSYAWTARSGNLTLWSRAGDEVLSATLEIYGEFHAAPDAVRIASKYNTNTSVQVVPIDGSPPHLTPAFAGTFHAWSRDGARFLTTTGNTVRVYSRTGVQESIVNLPEIDNLAATGDYLWTHRSNWPGNPLKIYRIGGGRVPVAHYEYNSGTTVVPTERAIGVFNLSSTKIEVIDLGGSEITRTEHEVAVYPPMLAHIDGGLRWAIGTSAGVISQKGTVADPDATGTLGCGASKLGGAASGQVAIATPAGAIFVYDTADLGAGPTASVPLLSAGVRLSADGRVLAARATERDRYIESRDLRIFSLPDGAEVASFDSDVALLDFSLSASGTTLGRTYHRSDILDGDRIVSDVSGATVIYEDTGFQPVPVISPDGRHFLVTDEAIGDGCGFTQFYVDGVLVNAVPGCAVGWLDDTRALVQTYFLNFLTSRWELQASTIYDELGNVIATPPLPRITLAPSDYTADHGKPAYGMVPISPTAILARYERAIYDIETGATLATLPEASVIAGSSVVYPCGNAICAAPY
ncbi:hypothetical protein [Sorangium sp. So ce1335]|uniref:hypothetical protein n=1 Tax=Sorangium sp. So ce1335 TaxID=3133335 RepID=UPI003F5F799C